LVISNHNSFGVLFEKIGFVYFIWKIYLHFSIGNHGTSTVPVVSAHFSFVCSTERVQDLKNRKMSRFLILKKLFKNVKSYLVFWVFSRNYIWFHVFSNTGQNLFAVAFLSAGLCMSGPILCVNRHKRQAASESCCLLASGQRLNLICVFRHFVTL